MSRRARVPRRKQLGGHRRERNANPKLSPYQREQKRDKLANQAPVSLQTRDFPAKARRLQAFLVKDKERSSAKQEREEHAFDKAMKKHVAEEWEVDFEPTTLAVPDPTAAATEALAEPLDDADDYGEAASAKASSSSSSSSESSEVDEEDDVVSVASDEELLRSAPKKAVEKSRQKSNIFGAVSLNSSLQVEPTAESDEVIKRLERKKLKALKKRDKRREDRVGKMSAKVEALDVLLNKKLRKDDDLRGQALKAVRDADKSTRRKKGEKKDPKQKAIEAKKEAKERAAAALEPKFKEAREFEDMVDVVRFGDRSDAPPKFDTLPTSHPALIPTQGMSKSKHQQLVDDARREKNRRLMQGANAAGIFPTAGKKTTTLPDGTRAPLVKNAKLESTEDFAALRERVMARYSKANAGVFNQRRRNVQFTVGGEPILE